MNIRAFILLTCITASVAMTPALAAPFRLFGDSDGDGFTLASGEVPSAFSPDDFWIYGVPVTDAAGKVSLHDFHFKASAAGGGLGRQEAGGLTGLRDYSGPVLFTGPTSAPIFILGSFSLIGPGGSGSYELTISAVPEPTSWGMLITGFGLTGAAMRRRQRVGA
jgi:hypothetical protein